MKWHIFPRLTLFGRRWFFNLKSANGQIVLQSEGYRNRVDAMRTVERIKIEGSQASIFVEPS